MRIISEANESLLTILRLFSNNATSVRWSQYCVHLSVDEGVLAYNLLTREMILLTLEEYDNFSAHDYLKAHWFVVPKTSNEKEMADFVKLVLKNRQPQSDSITHYTIFTTTDCNARCFYCFELGRSRVPMSCETAEKVVQYIKSHCGNEKVSINWFGGEPLFNLEAIDCITDGLRSENIEFSSKMTSNGYLFNENVVQKAVERWHLTKVQIPLDGTEMIYNKTKAYIYRDTNPYEIVMNNIDRLLNAGIRVAIRLNMDLYNAEDLLLLANELGERFANQRGLFVYARHLFVGDTDYAELHSEEEWQKRDIAMGRLNDILERNGLLLQSGISKKIPLHHCIADNGMAITILPNGNLGLCDHHTDDEFFGHIDHPEYDTDLIKSWKVRMPEVPECAKCFFYLDCIKLKKCPNDSVCFTQFRQEKLRHTQHTMLCEYKKWLTMSCSKEADDFSI